MSFITKLMDTIRRQNFGLQFGNRYQQIFYIIVTDCGFKQCDTITDIKLRTTNVNFHETQKRINSAYTIFS